MKPAFFLLFLTLPVLAGGERALVFLIAGQSNAGGVAAFSPETNDESGMADKYPTLPGSTAKEVGIPTPLTMLHTAPFLARPDGASRCKS